MNDNDSDSDGTSGWHDVITTRHQAELYSSQLPHTPAISPTIHHPAYSPAPSPVAAGVGASSSLRSHQQMQLMPSYASGSGAPPLSALSFLAPHANPFASMTAPGHENLLLRDAHLLHHHSTAANAHHHQLRYQFSATSPTTRYLHHWPAVADTAAAEHHSFFGRDSRTTSLSAGGGGGGSFTPAYPSSPDTFTSGSRASLETALYSQSAWEPSQVTGYGRAGQTMAMSVMRLPSDRRLTSASLGQHPHQLTQQHPYHSRMSITGQHQQQQIAEPSRYMSYGQRALGISPPLNLTKPPTVARGDDVIDDDLMTSRHRLASQPSGVAYGSSVSSNSSTSVITTNDYPTPPSSSLTSTGTPVVFATPKPSKPPSIRKLPGQFSTADSFAGGGEGGGGSKENIARQHQQHQQRKRVTFLSQHTVVISPPVSSRQSTTSYSSSSPSSPESGSRSKPGSRGDMRSSSLVGSAAPESFSVVEGQDDDAQGRGGGERSSFGGFCRGSNIRLADGRVKRIEHLSTADFFQVSTLRNMAVGTATVTDMTLRDGSALLTFSINQQMVKVTVPLEQPFFVVERGWCSPSPYRSALLYGLHCDTLAPGDRCVSLFDHVTTATSFSDNFSVETAKSAMSLIEGGHVRLSMSGRGQQQHYGGRGSAVSVGTRGSLSESFPFRPWGPALHQRYQGRAAGLPAAKEKEEGEDRETASEAVEGKDAAANMAAGDDRRRMGEKEKGDSDEDASNIKRRRSSAPDWY